MGMTLKQALESDEVRGYMADCVEAEVSKVLMARGLGTGAGRLAARDVITAGGFGARHVSASGRAVMEAYWPGLGEEPSAAVEPSEADEPVEAAPEPSSSAVLESDLVKRVGVERERLAVRESERSLPGRLARLDDRTRGALGLDGAA